MILANGPSQTVGPSLAIGMPFEHKLYVVPDGTPRSSAS
jgi:hypothetical protein